MRAARVALPVPALTNVELAVQWLALDPARREPLAPDALRIALRGPAQPLRASSCRARNSPASAAISGVMTWPAS